MGYLGCVSDQQPLLFRASGANAAETRSAALRCRWNMGPADGLLSGLLRSFSLHFKFNTCATWTPCKDTFELSRKPGLMTQCVHFCCWFDLSERRLGLVWFGLVWLLHVSERVTLSLATAGSRWDSRQEMGTDACAAFSRQSSNGEMITSPS